MQPPANSYTDNPNEQLETFPLQMMLCNNCGHSQLSVIVNPEILFSNYLYVSGTTKTLENHFKEFAKECTDNYGVGKVLEIGCNDGSCLKQFKALGWNTLGIDPAKNLLPLSRDNGIIVIPIFWEKGASGALGTLDKCKIIYGTNVFAHNSSPYDFLNECLNVLEEDGTIIIEAPYSFNMFKIIDVGQIYHEHINYLSCNAMMKLCDRLNIAIVDIVETNVHGGSIRFYLKSNMVHSEIATLLAEWEVSEGILDTADYKTFAEKLKYNLNKLHLNINELRKNYKVIGYGAAAKASTIINALEEIPLSYIVDDNPLKVGKYMPSTNIQILPTSTIEKEPQDLAIWITAHNFKKEIIERIKAKRPNRNDIIINNTPTVNTEPI